MLPGTRRIRAIVPPAALAAVAIGLAPGTARAQCPAFSSLQPLIEEGFDDPALASRGWYDNTNLTISGVEHVPGSAGSVEYRFLVGARTPESGGGIRRLFTPSDRVHVSYWVKYSANWEGSNRPYHPHEFNIVTNLDSMWVGPAFTHLTAYIEQNEGTPMLSIQDGSNIDQAQVGVDLTAVTEARAVAGCNGDSDGHGPGDCYLNGALYWNGKSWRAPMVYFQDAPGPYDKNDWHFVEAYFQLNTIRGGIGQRDGRVAYWFDGESVFDHDDVLIRTGQHPGMLFDQFLVAPYIGDGSPVDQTMWVDELTVGRPGPSLLRNDELSSLSPPTPALASIFAGTGSSLDERGPDDCPQEGEGALASANGSSDDDDFYLANPAPGTVDPDSGADPARPLVFYELGAEPGAVLRLGKDGSGRVVLSW